MLSNLILPLSPSSNSTLKKELVPVEALRKPPDSVKAAALPGYKHLYCWLQ